ncbi:MAG: hypothetical protein RIC03_01480, partial [Cyclobacteriaceae bacterium]
MRKRQDLYNKSRVMGDYQARFCERLGLKCPCLLDSRRYASLAELQKNMNKEHVNMAFYWPEDWSRLLSIVDDKEVF